MTAPRQLFSETYFAYLISGEVGDFATAASALNQAVAAGASWADLQQEMNRNHLNAERLAVSSPERTLS